jgi:hypothetical protein
VISPAAAGEGGGFRPGIAPIVAGIVASGIGTDAGIADALNARGIATARGGNWHPQTVKNVEGSDGAARVGGEAVRLDVRLACDLANVPPAAADAFRASADRLFNAALERVKELAAAYAYAAEPPRPVEARNEFAAGRLGLWAIAGGCLKAATRPPLAPA